MNNKNLAKVALRYRAIFLDVDRNNIDLQSVASAPVVAFVARLKENGYCVSEELLHALNAVSADQLAEITLCINSVMGTDLNWAPLVKGWNVPTGESVIDHIITLVANIFGEKAGVKGATLPCGHLIPNGTFPLERYNGCPFCGKQFQTTDFVYKGQGSKLKELRLFTLDDLLNVFRSLLSSPTPLDGTQRDNLGMLLHEFPLPENADIAMKETAMLVVKLLVAQNCADDAQRLLKTPTDVLRYLWFEKTGYAQIIEPKTLVAHARRLYSHLWKPLSRGDNAADEMKKNLMLKYDRKACLRVAKWLNNQQMTPRQAAENMNPKRGMWVRMIRALRLGEYSRKNGFEHLAAILDVFYKQDYTTWQGKVDKDRAANNADQTLALLKERPGLFARCLFATMLRFGSDKVLAAFSEIANALPARLLLSLDNSAEIYFNANESRIARPITGITHQIEPNKMLALYDVDARKSMIEAVRKVYKQSMTQRFAAQKTKAKSIYIDPALYQIPVAVGDRSATVQDASCALMGTRFPIEGDAVRLFLQWGKGLHSQHLDMDLSCNITFANGRNDVCAYYNLTCVGAKHSGDIREIPEMVGAAEYIELSLPELESAGAQYVTFTCNAYSVGALSPNLVFGWMDSANPMRVSEQTGVAYDPSCVQHLVRISQGNLSKGLVFGVLNVANREIIWLEMPFTAQTIQGVNSAAVEALLHKLDKKIKVGELLDLKADAQKLTRSESADSADEVYTNEWALNPADVSAILNA